MENSYFIYSEGNDTIIIERFHICIWEFKNKTSLVEFGAEINSEFIKENKFLKLSIHIPWLESACQIEDFYNRLKLSSNSKFIFNDSINNVKSLDGGDNLSGVIHEFSSRNQLCITPIKFERDYDLKNNFNKY
jgi:hypothetical protein